MNEHPSQADDAEAADDQAWLDLMAGRSRPEARHRMREESVWLRAALLSYRPAQPQGQMPDPEARAERLLQRARAAGILAATQQQARPEPRPSPAWEVRAWLHKLLRPQLWAPGLGLLFCGVLGYWNWPGTLAPPVAEERIERGSAGATVLIRSPDPAGRRQQMLEALRAVQLDAQPYERLGRLGLDLELPERLTPEQVQALKALQLDQAQGPSLLIEFEP
ncbi:hypothetical protein HNP55_004421 [Paucibacter oligotrophus]|uniref:Uncharacterized protein n=1 Tax=Roseateles oligotrophus TaxID=1769250 RepID=A0A840LKP9_9BURK|nr:hypothetical protein [Roseateles oligotrophus]MBB4845867.1 hypothetical protein [Roseateles oligotrophus]